MEPAIVTLVMGIVLGYLAQRSRICFIGGLRDFVLVRDTELLKGAIAFFITAWVAFSISGAVGLLDWGAPAFDELTAVQDVAASVASPAAVTRSVQVLGLSAVIVGLVAGIALGLFSTLANGCPTRQHVLAAQGVRDSVFYLGGFYLGVVIYNLVTKPLLALVF
jgi:uncharacterized membrane protein YedE/YeeE